MNDYHSNETVYTDTFRDCPKRARPRARRDCPWPALAAPSSKTWDGARNCAGATLFWEKERFPRAPFVENLARFSLGSARGLSFSEKKHPSHIQTHPDQDDAYWEYWYDGRLRLTKAERDNSGDELQKRYTYIYDDGDNMLTKVVYDAVGESTTTTAFEYTNANELTKQTEGGTTTNFTYDKYGRMTGKTQGGYSATYAYRYSQMLYSVTSDFPGEGTVTYEYGGDLKRRERTTGGTTTNYNWDAGFTMINEEDSGGTLTMTYIGKLADVSGSNPSTGTWRYYSHDHLGSTRRLRAADKSSLGQYEYTPYGQIYSESGATIINKFAFKTWDAAANLYYTPSGYYAPSVGRSTTGEHAGSDDDSPGDNDKPSSLEDCYEKYNLEMWQMDMGKLEPGGKTYAAIGTLLLGAALGVIDIAGIDIDNLDTAEAIFDIAKEHAEAIKEECNRSMHRRMEWWIATDRGLQNLLQEHPTGKEGRKKVDKWVKLNFKLTGLDLAVDIYEVFDKRFHAARKKLKKAKRKTLDCIDEVYERESSSSRFRLDLFMLFSDNPNDYRNVYVHSDPAK